MDDPIKLKNEFGKHITFWGGGFNIQKIESICSIEQISNEVKFMIEIFSPGGGFVFNQVHNIQASVSPEKVMAIL